MADEKTPAIPPDLAGLADQADAHAAETTAAAAPAAAGQAEQAPRLTNAECLLGIFRTTRDLARELGGFQSVNQLTDDKLQLLANPWARVMDQKGIDLGAKAQDWPLLDAGMATFVVLLPFARDLRDELAARRAKAESESRLTRMPIVPMGVVADAHGGPNG